MVLTRIKSSIALFVVFLFLCFASNSIAQVDKVSVYSDDQGSKIQVNGEDFMVLGLNWDYFPLGTNYNYSLWNQSEDIIKAALDQEIPLVKAMGVNAIRQYTGVPPKWVKYIYEEYGIFTILNHSFGRYGVTIDGAYVSNTDYGDPKTKEVLLSEVKAVVEEFKDTPGVLMWLLGNENNYGLFWGGAETEDIPVGETLESVRARHMYQLFNDGINLIKSMDDMRPVAIANGDLLFIEIIAEEIENLDIFGTNVYRGLSFGDAFQRVQDLLGLPILYTEFGADAFNARTQQEDQYNQSVYNLANWKEIYQNSYGKGLANNAVGGLTFQFSDGWWKYGQETGLSTHDSHASWSNGGYLFDYTEDGNNMNEEWFGICAKGPTNAIGLYELYPRASYYTLKEAYKLDPYGPGVNINKINYHFSKIGSMEGLLRARADKAALATEDINKLRVSGVRMEFETYSTGGDLISTPDARPELDNTSPAFLGFDHMQSFYVDVEANPASNVSGKVSFNMLGNVPLNPIDEIFYENRGRPKTVLTKDGSMTLSDIERFKIYKASIQWTGDWFDLDAFYRTGHYHWGYEGDFFGLYPESNYGENIDIYNGNAPLGFEIEAKKSLEGLKIAFGPELWWGANPAILFKYSKAYGPWEITGMYHEDLDEQGTAVSSFAVPLPPTRKATLHLGYTYGKLGIEVGGIWSGNTKINQDFQIVTGSTGNYQVLQDQIKPSDTYGGKVKITLSSGIWNWYMQGAAKGLVADGGVNQALTFTGWRLKDSGTGNQYNFLSGFTVILGDFQVAPNFMWQKPIEGPIPNDVQAPGRPRNILADPFAVRGNRETTAGELLITYDPTPATWMYQWNSDVIEDAPFAVSAGFVYRNHPTTRDAAIGILGDGRTIFAFPGAPPARDLWETHARIVSKLSHRFGLIANLYGGTGEPNGDDDRLIYRYGGDLRVIYNSMKLMASVKVNDWGPYDYHRDFNLTYPLQVMADFSTVVGTPRWFDLPSTTFGVRATYRSLNEYSPRYCPTMTLNAAGELECDPTAPGFDNGNEWEIRTYLQLSLGM
ncbi:MAG: hypothetical protein K9J12_03335 [Melioribacteraceae bacterium]|nr:hypothetical protein [Melioribacteraceae bacterium]